VGTIVQSALLVSTVPGVPLWMQNVEYRVLVRFKPALTCTGIYTSVLPAAAPRILYAVARQLKGEQSV